MSSQIIVHPNKFFPIQHKWIIVVNPKCLLKKKKLLNHKTTHTHTQLTPEEYDKHVHIKN